MEKQNFYQRFKLLHNEIVQEIKRLMEQHRVTEVDLLGSSCDHAYVTGYPGDGSDVQEMEVSRVYLRDGHLWLDVILDIDTEELAASNENGDIGEAYQCWRANDFTHFKPCCGIEMVYESVCQVLAAKDDLERIAEDEDLQEDFFIRFGEELASDEEPARKKFVRLYEAYKKDPETVDDILMTLCGWTMKSLAEKTFE